MDTAKKAAFQVILALAWAVFCPFTAAAAESVSDGSPIAPIPSIAAPLGNAAYYGNLLQRQQSGEILDLSAVTRPGIAMPNGELLSVAQGSGRFEALRGGQSMDLFVPQDAKLPQGVSVVQRDVPTDIVSKANLLSTRGNANSHPALVDELTADKTFMRVLAPREVVEAPLSQAARELEKLRAVLETGDDDGGIALLESPAFKAQSLREQVQAVRQLPAALIDISGHTAAPETSAGLPRNTAGQVLGRLRQAGKNNAAGPGAIPGITGVEWEDMNLQGRSGQTSKVRIQGKLWYLKRLGNSPDSEIQSTPLETRASNEAGFTNVLRADPLLSQSFSVTPRLNVFRDGEGVYVLSQGLPSVGDGDSKRQELTPTQRADASLIQLVLGLGDMHGGDVLPLSGGGYGLVDFEKLSRAPLEKMTLHDIDEQVLLKNYPLVDRLSYNDPALYRSRFETWLSDYRNGGRARMDQALSHAGWSRAARAVYLSAVDKNALTYLDRLEPYLTYANDWHTRIVAARAEQARQKAAPRKKGFLEGLFGN